MPDLVATAWTSAGATSPMRVPATSPVPISQRVEAVADAGYCGLGLIVDDLAVIRDTIGYEGLRDLLSEHGLTHIEIELIERWWIPRGEPGHTYDVRDLLFDAADVLSPSFIKIGSENGPVTDDPLALVDPLRDLADEADKHGTRVAIEPMPFSAIATRSPECGDRQRGRTSCGRPGDRRVACLPRRDVVDRAEGGPVAEEHLRRRTE